MTAELNSCIFEGKVRHRRNFPKQHQFDFRLFMLMLDLDEIDQVFRGRWFWSNRRISVAQFRQQDHLKAFAEHGSLKDRVFAALADLGFSGDIDQVKLLTQVRFLGFEMNPVSFYYCYQNGSARPAAIIAEVNNTPWGEQHLYLVNPDSADQADEKSVRAQQIQKTFHVSPFMSLNMFYRMAFSIPGKSTAVRIENHVNADHEFHSSKTSEHRQAKDRILDVTMLLRRKPLTSLTLNWMLIKYPLLSFQVFAGIYWQALRLYFKRIKFHPHPKKQSDINGSNLEPEVNGKPISSFTPGHTT